MTFTSLALAAALLAPPSTSPPNDAAASGLAVEISSPSRSIGIGQPFALRVRLVNRGPQTIVLRGNPGFTDVGGFELRVAETGGNERALPVRRTDIDRDELLSGPRRQLLRPDSSFVFSYLIPVEQTFTRPGQVQLRVRYQSPQPLPGNPSVQAGEIEGASAVSAPLSIEVRQ